MAGDDDVPPNPKIDSTSPYYLGSLAVPEAKISNVVLRRDNYDDWKNSMRMSLKSRRKFGFIDGSLKKSTDPFYLENWEVVHGTLVQWIRNTIDPSLLDTISYVEDASVLWNDLAAQFSVVDGTVIHNLKTQIKNCVQTKGMDITTYYGKLKNLWDSLVVHEPPFSCKCGNCSCNIGQDAVKRQDSERLHQFLMGLDSTLYGHIRSQQLQLDPLPSLTRVYHAMLQEERLRASPTAVVDASDMVAFATMRPPLDSRNQERGERHGLFCHFCDTRGHELHNCYIKSQRFSEWWGDRPHTLADLRRSHANKASRGSGFASAGGSGTGTAAAASVSAPGNGSGAGTVHANMLTTGVSTNSVLTSDRLSGMCSWIIDTGASNHVTGDLSCLTDCYTIMARPVGLPNGQRVESTLMGSAFINSSLTLTQVLYVPSLTCNLLSVSQLASTRDFIFEFAKSSCLIQDRSLKTTIGVGELRDGLYWIRACSVSAGIHQVSASGSRDLWHRRLGHPSDHVVKTIIPFASSLNFNKDWVCDVCHLAKQHRNSFSNNEQRALDIFDLIHCDLWGPYRIPSSCGAKYFLTIVDDFSRATWVYLLLDKTEVTDMFMNFINMVSTQFSKTLKVVQSDNGTEFNCMAGYFFAHGIRFQKSCVGTPQQNGRLSENIVTF
ncbi:uncharacterized protein LOC141613544 [Silene latifolia]|uniref:uncharacterized protein LOC141613544 n=1 Tax=Silene latifolia TaxID=37657 RepID=UPI003D76D9B9